MCEHSTGLGLQPGRVRTVRTTGVCWGGGEGGAGPNGAPQKVVAPQRNQRLQEGSGQKESRLGAWKSCLTVLPGPVEGAGSFSCVGASPAILRRRTQVPGWPGRPGESQSKSRKGWGCSSVSVPGIPRIEKPCLTHKIEIWVVSIRC